MTKWKDYLDKGQGVQKVGHPVVLHLPVQEAVFAVGVRTTLRKIAQGYLDRTNLRQDKVQVIEKSTLKSDRSRQTGRGRATRPNLDP